MQFGTVLNIWEINQFLNMSGVFSAGCRGVDLHAERGTRRKISAASAVARPVDVRVSGLPVLRDDRHGPQQVWHAADRRPHGGHGQPLVLPPRQANDEASRQPEPRPQ